MNASDIIRLLSSNHYSPADLEEVNKVCEEYPEFSTAHLLKVRILEALGHEKQKELKLAAVYSMNRKKLMDLVTEVKHPPEPEYPDEPPETDDFVESIHFSEESNQEVDIIIEQHAPYAGPETDSSLLELDEEAPDQDQPELDEEATDANQPEEDEEATDADQPEEDEEATDADQLPSSLEKDETDMEEPESLDDELPAIDLMDDDQENSNDHLIRTFIMQEPGPIRADRETSLKGDVSLASIREHDGFITDTLAQIYVKQGLFAKAIYAYEKLSLKYPEKSAYFAAQIEKIRNINHS